ncbi:uncharacterized protein MONOS_11639 [Monocercomonoides exilis]|uniref:uncharacterized protein n=1 Tax=Monocercomonoides exilis TaxID=2049356 RepID=UPI003559BF32|nr:hypothetical protein MONOS_11639 [Monocercomonoides exilis]|eukprot:MONOS_11639.1-p1 / transcript=MONOS_11639.1 / gene=MONOS_11639 / organism=Monocercomonoides_exilis_PA203 / gene_product=unspecified product / transcript_product=unspecified product / location=Mono_scaffold00596:12480-15749(-) / protein_length=968 / sequence_SO=supercontig / SO=protein_coding / is_pseudo=false
MEKSPLLHLARGEKTQTRVSGDDGDDEELFIPSKGGSEGRSGESSVIVGGEVVQPDIHGDKEKRKVEEDPGLQSSKRGSAGKTLQDGFPGDSCGTPGGERLDNNSGHIECLSTCQSGRAIQSLSVLQLSKSMLSLRGDAIWSKGRAQSIHEDNETGSIVYQRTLESEARNIPGRHSPHAPRQGCIEIDLSGNGTVPEVSGLDSVGGEAEARTRKERGVFGMELEFREDGSDAPREEENVAPGGCANLDSTGTEEEETKDEGLSSTPREAEFCEVTTPTSELVDEAHAIRAEACNSPRRLERDSDTQPNDSGRINTLEENSAREQTEVSKEENKASRVYNGLVKAVMGFYVNSSDCEQRGENICPRELGPPGKHACNKRDGVQSSVEDSREKGSMAATTEDRPYSSEDRQHVHQMDNTEEEGSAIAHSNTESIREETEQPGHYDTNGTSPGRPEHGSRCTQPDGEKAGLCTERGESRRDITNSRTENTRNNLRTDCACALRKYLETILREKEERERNTRRRHSACPPVPEKHWTDPEREDEGSPEGTNDSDSASLAGADLDPATAVWAFDKDPGDLSGVHDTSSEDEKGRLETTPRRGDIRHTGEENIQVRDLFLTWEEYVGARDIAAAILRNQKSERDTWRSLRRFKQFLDRESMEDTDPLTTRDAKWIMTEFTEKLSNTNLTCGVINQIVRKALNPINLFGETKMDAKDIEIYNLKPIERQPANLKRIKEELSAILRENEIPDTYTAFSIRHAVITHLARQQDADWKAINAYTRCAPGSRVVQEYYTVLPVQDTNWILETIGGTVPLAEKGDKSEKDSERKDIGNENTESETKEYPEEISQSGGEGDMSKRKRSKRRVPIRERSSQHESDIAQLPKGDETPSLIPRNIMELTERRQTALQKKLETDRGKRGERSIGQIVMPAQVQKTRSRTPENSARGGGSRDRGRTFIRSPSGHPPHGKVLGMRV